MTLLQRGCDDFDRFQQRPNITAGSEARTQINFVTIYGLTCHAHELVRAGLLDRTTPSIALIPIVRSIYEAGVTAQWLRWMPRSELALLRSRGNLHSALTSELLASPIDWQQDVGRRRQEDDQDTVDLGEAGSLPSTKFKDICFSFNQGEELYVYYRLMCGQMHAGVEAAETWLHDEGQGSLTLRRTPGGESAATWPYFAVLGLIWASRAFDDVLKKSVRSNFLNGLARDARIPSLRYTTATRLTPRRAG